MNVKAYIGTFFRKKAGDALMDRLLATYPEGSRAFHGDGFEIHLDVEDARLKRVLDILKSAGMQPIHFGMSAAELDDQTRYYNLRLSRIYSRAELDGYSLFEFRAPSEAGVFNVARGASGHLEIPVPTLLNSDSDDLSQWDFLCSAALETWLITSTSIRDVLALADLSHVVFNPTMTPSTHRSEGGINCGTYWEMTSDFILPAASPMMVLVDSQSRTYLPPGRAGGLRRLDGLYNFPELHYRASDLRAVGTFDAARTFESFWGSGNERRPDYCPLVVSKRFYDLCHKHGLKVDWLPVHIDPI